MRKKSTSLAIVEKGFRGAIEEQYGNIVWLSECMKAMGAEHNLLLCGSALTTCIVQQTQQTVKIGDITIKTISDFKTSVEDLLKRGATIWVLSKDIASLADGHQLIKGIHIADSMADLCLEHDDVWFW